MSVMYSCMLCTHDYPQDGRTALHLSAINGRIKSAALLIEFGYHHARRRTHEVVTFVTYTDLVRVFAQNGTSG